MRPARSQTASKTATGRLSFYGFNMDFVYSLTVSDSAKARQPLSANPLVQMSYDLHF